MIMTTMSVAVEQVVPVAADINFADFWGDGANKKFS